MPWWIGCVGESDRSEPEPPAPWFADVTEELGIDLRYDSGDQGERWLPTIMGGGVAVFDADGDGLLDLYLVNGNHDLLAESATGPATNRLFLQQADGTFRDGTSGSGLGDAHYGIGVALGDIDNDGRVDVYVTNYGPDRLFRNLGGGRFEDITEEAGIAVGGHGASAVFCDFDGDGWLDLFVTRYLHFDPELSCFDPAGRRDYCGPQGFEPASDVLLRNLGGGRFRDVSVEAGIAELAGYGLGVVCEDFTGDGRMDFLVANDGDANHLWLNQGDGRFVEAGTSLGVAYNHLGRAEAGMGVIAADLHGEGRLDAFMTHLHQQTNTLYRNLGEAGFADVTGTAGLGFASFPYTGFGVAAVDLDLSGLLDLVVVNGRVRSHSPPDPFASVPPHWNRLAEPNQVFRHVSAGRFEPLDPERCGDLCRHGEISRGLVAADLHGSGATDLIVVNIESPTRIYRNLASRKGGWISVRAVDEALRRDAIGARVTLYGTGAPQMRTITSGGSYLSATPPVARFGLGATEPEALEVAWPDGLRERFPVDCLDCAVTLYRGHGQVVP